MSEALVDRPDVLPKGSVVWVQSIGAVVEIWISSPTGDASDSYIQHIECINTEQAEGVTRLWKAIWGIR